MTPDIPSSVLESLTLVGSTKAIGYLPLQTVTQVLQLNVEDAIAHAAACGLNALSIGPQECCINSGALYVFDAAALEAILRNGVATLEQVNAPTDPTMFVRFIARYWFPADHPIMPIIRTAFADNIRSA
ncbi:hypothetical protein [Bosea sp. CS1GBMeth4]|uniref:hypothetical protein n=1 Tax=Bosea sp. CS1GBMeth4 TaxID=1892849 RepID=UPI001644210C|nr:hypothetical protein [Bosea sp. CS1GBMeth4]